MNRDDGERIVKMANKLWSPEELAEHLDVPVKTVYSWNYKGTGPRFSKVGRHVRYRPKDIESWLDAQRAG